MSHPVASRHQLVDLGDGFAFIPGEAGGSGSLLRQHPRGDTQFPGWPDRWVVLGEVPDEAEARSAVQALPSEGAW